MKTEDVETFRIKGIFSLILYSGQWPDAIANVAFFDIEEDRISLKPYAPDFSYEVIRNLSADEALARAQAFVSQNSSFRRAAIAAIKDDYDRLIGYEMRPLYIQTTFGSENILDISYRQKDNQIDIFIRLDPNVELRL